MIHTKSKELQGIAPFGSVVMLGNFDGLHLGHLELLRQLLVQGGALGLCKIVFSFYPHPFQVMKAMDSKQTGLLLLSDEKAELLRELGVDAFIEYPFDDTLRNMEAEDFVLEILVRGLNARAVVMGSSSGFGRKRAGDVRLMRTLGLQHGFELHEVSPLLLDGEAVSSTRIREAVLAGDMESAQRMMTRPYQISGMVERGRRLGRELGFPTLNVWPPSEKLLPPNGVYLTRTRLPSGTTLPSITNVGRNPTIESGAPQPRCETHVYDFAGDIYGQRVVTYFLKRVRDEMKFSGIDELRKQVLDDIALGRQMLKNFRNME